MTHPFRDISILKSNPSHLCEENFVTLVSPTPREQSGHTNVPLHLWFPPSARIFSCGLDDGSPLLHPQMLSKPRNYPRRMTYFPLHTGVVHAFTAIFAPSLASVITVPPSALPSAMVARNCMTEVMAISCLLEATTTVQSIPMF